MNRMIRIVFIAVCFAFSCGFLIPAGTSAQNNCITDAKSGVKVCQITSGGSNRLGYYDTPLYSDVYKKITYLKKPDAGPPQVAIANLDGSGEELLSVGQDPVFSPDGKKVYYISRGSGGPGMDLFAYDLGTRVAIQITQ